MLKTVTFTQIMQIRNPIWPPLVAILAILMHSPDQTIPPNNFKLGFYTSQVISQVLTFVFIYFYFLFCFILFYFIFNFYLFIYLFIYYLF